MATDDPLRAQLVRALDWHEAHTDFAAATKGIPADKQGIAPAGLHSPWQLLEHLRIAQHDILEFCVNPAYNDVYKHVKWPDDYWPASAGPPNAQSWKESIAAYERDRGALQRMVEDPAIDLFARIPHGSGQTYLREVFLVVDHAAYHIGQLVLVRRLLGLWP
jgi:hypothetical protein